MASPSSPVDQYRAQQGMAPVTHSFDPKLVSWIRQAAAETGADPAALLATSLQESGARLNGPAGDGGTSFGPFQFHRGGALGNHSPAWASTYEAVLNRAHEFAKGQVHHGKGAAAVQRPRDQRLYARGVDSFADEARAILGKGLAQKPKRPKAPRVTDTVDHADEGPLMLEALARLHPNSGGSGIQQALNANAALAGIAAPTLPVVGQAASTPTVHQAVTRPKSKPKMPAAPMPRAGGGWAGSHNLALAMAAIGKRNGLSIASEKRARRNTTSGNMSDHYEGNKSAYAFDLSNGSAPTPQMDATAAQIAASLGVKNWKGGVLNVNRGGYRYQLLYRTRVGGNHFNHVHVGVRKL